MAKVKTMEVSVYSAKITFQKYIYELLTLLAITGLTYAIDVIFPDISLSYPEYAGVLLIVAPLIRAVINWLKHRNDTEEVPVE